MGQQQQEQSLLQRQLTQQQQPLLQQQQPPQQQQPLLQQQQPPQQQQLTQQQHPLLQQRMLSYPPVGDVSHRFVKYLLTEKKIPAELPLALTVHKETFDKRCLYTMTVLGLISCLS